MTLWRLEIGSEPFRSHISTTCDTVQMCLIHWYRCFVFKEVHTHNSSMIYRRQDFLYFGLLWAWRCAFLMTATSKDAQSLIKFRGQVFSSLFGHLLARCRRETRNYQFSTLNDGEGSSNFLKRRCFKAEALIIIVIIKPDTCFNIGEPF